MTFYPSWIPDPGVEKAPDPGSGSAALSVCNGICILEERLGRFGFPPFNCGLAFPGSTAIIIIVGRAGVSEATTIKKKIWMGWGFRKGETLESGGEDPIPESGNYRAAQWGLGMD
jgi:hypothetical protein